jgi:hypothetical protein
MSEVIYRVKYVRKSDGSEFQRDFRSHASAKQFSAKKQREPGWHASWPVKIS